MDHIIRNKISSQSYHSGLIGIVVFSTDGWWLRGQVITRCGSDTWECNSLFEGYLDQVSTVVFPFYGQLVASGSTDDTMRRWKT